MNEKCEDKIQAIFDYIDEPTEYPMTAEFCMMSDLKGIREALIILAREIDK